VLESDRGHDAAVQPDAVTHVAVADHRPASTTQTGTPAADLSFHGIGLPDVEDEDLAGHCRMSADTNPLVRSILLHDNSGEHPKRAISWFGQSESLVATSIGHGSFVSNGRAAMMTLMEGCGCVTSLNLCPKVFSSPQHLLVPGRQGCRR
jgi:hypothetical protein